MPAPRAVAGGARDEAGRDNALVGDDQRAREAELSGERSEPVEGSITEHHACPQRKVEGVSFRARRRLHWTAEPRKTRTHKAGQPERHGRS